MNIRSILNYPFTLANRKGLWSTPCLYFSVAGFILGMMAFLFFYLNPDIPHSETYNAIVFLFAFILIPAVITFQFVYMNNRGRLKTLADQIEENYRLCYALALKIFHRHYSKHPIMYAYHDCSHYNNGTVSKSEWNCILNLMCSTPINSDLDIKMFASDYQDGIALMSIYPLREHFFATQKSAVDYVEQCKRNRDFQCHDDNLMQFEQWMELANSQRQRDVLASVCQDISAETTVVLRSRRM